MQHSTSHNTCLYLLTAAFERNHMTQESPPHLHSISSTPTFCFPVDINFGWLHKSVTHHYQHKYWNILFLSFTTIQHTSNFQKLINSYQYNYWIFYLSISLTFSCSSTQLLEHFYFSLFVNSVVKFFTCLFVIWFTTMCFVLSLQPYTRYNMLNQKLWHWNITSTKRDPSVLTMGKIDTLNLIVNYSGKIPKKVLKGTTKKRKLSSLIKCQQTQVIHWTICTLCVINE